MKSVNRAKTYVTTQSQVGFCKLESTIITDKTDLNTALRFNFKGYSNIQSLNKLWSLALNLRKLFYANSQACPCECHSYGNPMGNVPWDGTGINCYGMGMGQINMSHGQL